MVVLSVDGAAHPAGLLQPHGIGVPAGAGAASWC